MNTKTTRAALATAIALVAGIAVANRSVDLSNLDNLQAMDGMSMTHTKAALTWVNENALEHLPVAATLRAENVIAGVALRLGPTEVVAAR